MGDKYDKAIEYLTAHPNEIKSAWFESETHEHGCLFRHVSPNGKRKYQGKEYGCLTMIKLNPESYPAFTPELTKAIMADKQIPDNADAITIKSLPRFARWMRRIDKELNRV